MTRQDQKEEDLRIGPKHHTSQQKNLSTSFLTRCISCQAKPRCWPFSLFIIQFIVCGCTVPFWRTLVWIYWWYKGDLELILSFLNILWNIVSAPKDSLLEWFSRYAFLLVVGIFVYSNVIAQSVMVQVW